MTVASVNNAPKATNDAITTLEDTPVTVDVKANDTDADGDALTVTTVTQGTKGVVAIKADGTLTYTPNADLNGSDSFTYTISDGRGGTATATVAVTVTPVNDPPKAVSDAFTTLEDTPATVDVKADDTDVDGDALTVTVATQGAKGSVAINAAGSVAYTPNADLNGSDSFTYTVSDGRGGTATATVAVTVTPVNDPPIVNVPGAQAVDAGKLLAFTVTASDKDSQPVQITAASLPAGATFNGSSFSWKPTNAQAGSYTVSFTASDGSLSDSKTVTISVKVQIPEIAVGAIPQIYWYYYQGTWYPWVYNGGRNEVRNGEPKGFTTLGAPIYFQNGYYNSVRGETRPAIGDLDGDGLGELVLGANTGSYGNLEIFSSDGAHKSWATIPWSAYNSYNGETRPAMGDLDGDGRADIVVGLGRGSLGYLYLGSLTGGSFFKYYLQFPWSWYNSYNGETRPAVGDLDGDGKAEIVVGLGIGGNGYLAVFGSAAEGYRLKQWLQIPWPAYNSANGETRPAIGDLDGDGKAEIVVGLGKEAGGYLAVFGSTPSGYAFKQWLYAPSGSAGWPAVGDLDGDGKAEVLYGASGYTSIGLFRGGSLSFVGWINTAQPDPVPAIGNIVP